MACALVLIVGAQGVAVAERGKAPKSRQVQEIYQTPAPGLTPVHPYGAVVCNQGGAPGGGRGCLTFPVQFKERFARVEILDASGLPAPGFVHQGGSIDQWIPFCGETANPLRIMPGVELTVVVYAYRSPNLPLCAGVGTTGTVRVTFSTGI